MGLHWADLKTWQLLTVRTLVIKLHFNCFASACECNQLELEMHPGKSQMNCTVWNDPRWQDLMVVVGCNHWLVERNEMMRDDMIWWWLVGWEEVSPTSSLLSPLPLNAASELDAKWQVECIQHWCKGMNATLWMQYWNEYHTGMNSPHCLCLLWQFYSLCSELNWLRTVRANKAVRVSLEQKNK